MADDIFIPPQNIRAPDSVSRKGGAGHSGSGGKTDSGFGALLEHQLRPDAVRFSKHASARMQDRGIKLDQGSLKRLDHAIGLAKAKGCRDSLVLLDSNAMVVSIKDNKVVTVADKAQLKGNIFTNIDSAIIA